MTDGLFGYGSDDSGGFDTWRWHLGTEWTRDRMLREEMEAQAYEAEVSRRDRRHIESRLAKLEGSLEARLNALSRAFDAYVELGDLREELRRRPDWSHTRVAVGDALQALLAGAIPERLDTTEHRHWMAYACNAVINLVSGEVDRASEDEARRLSPQSTAFVAGAAVAVGRGELVADRLPELLINDGEASPLQACLIQAGALGLVGEGGLEPMREAVQPALTRAQWQRRPDEWGAGSPGRFTVATNPTLPQRVTQLVEAAGAEERDVAARTQGGLSAMQQEVARMAEAGDAEEEKLLHRAAALRALIESPDSPDAPSAVVARVPRVPVVEVITALIEDTGVPRRFRRELLSWCVEPLTEALRRSVAASPEPEESVVRIQQVDIRCTVEGPDVEAVAEARRRINAQAEEDAASKPFGLARGEAERTREYELQHMERRLQNATRSLKTKYERACEECQRDQGRVDQAIALLQADPA